MFCYIGPALIYSVVVYCTGMSTRKVDGELHPVKSDHDVLKLKENDVVIVEIKD